MVDIYDLRNKAISAVSPIIPIELPQILVAYFAEKIIEPETEKTEVNYTVEKDDHSDKISRKKPDVPKDVIKSTIAAFKEKYKQKYIHPGDNLTFVTEKVIGERVYFNPIKIGSVSQEVYIVVETQFFQEKKIQISIKQAKKKVIADIDQPIDIIQNGGSTHKIECTVGQFDEIKDAKNKEDYKDWAIAKITLKPTGEEKLKQWQDKINEDPKQRTNLYLEVDAHSQNSIYDKYRIAYCGRNRDETENPNAEDSIRNFWLDAEGYWFELITRGRAPWMDIVYGELGVEEIPGSKHNPRVLDYHKSANLTQSYVTDDKSYPWCASFLTWVMTQAGYKDLPKRSAKATNWKDWGTADSIEKPIYGAIAVIDWGRNDNGKGHISFFVGMDGDDYYLLGGNQTGGDKTTNGKVCVGKYRKKDIDYMRIPDDFTPISIDYKYDNIIHNDLGEYDTENKTR